MRLNPHDFPKNPKVPTGGSALFLRFIDEELRPRLQAAYPIDPNRAILAGHSLGGLFAAYVLLNHPDDFQGYIITSPSFWADPALLTAALTFKAPLPVQVFLAVGAEETGHGRAMIENTQAFARNLIAATAKVNVKLWVMSGEDHGSVPPAASRHAAGAEIRFASEAPLTDCGDRVGDPFWMMQPAPNFREPPCLQAFDFSLLSQFQSALRG